MIRSLASLNEDFKLGYVGVAGDTYTVGLNWLDTMRHDHIDYQFVKNDRDHKTGICISYISEDERRRERQNRLHAICLCGERPQLWRDDHVCADLVRHASDEQSWRNKLVERCHTHADAGWQERHIEHSRYEGGCHNHIKRQGGGEWRTEFRGG